jgi:hypothetical protein
MSEFGEKIKELKENQILFRVKQLFGNQSLLSKKGFRKWVFLGIILSALSSSSSAYDKKQTTIRRIAGRAVNVPRYASVTGHRIDMCWNQRLGGEFIYDLGEVRKINRLSWFFPQNRYSSPVDYDVYATDKNSYSPGQTIDLKKWTKIISRRKNIMREGRREKFATINACYILFKSIRSTNKKNLISIREFSVGYVPEEKVKDLIASSSNGKIALKWSPLKNIDEYRIYRSDSAKGKGFIITTSGPLKADKYVDTDIIPDKEYFYYVTALKDNWQGEKSNTVRVRTDNFTRTVSGWQSGISSRSTGRYGRMILEEARRDYVENVIGLTVLPDKKLNPELVFTTLRSPRADKLTPARLHAGIYKNLYIREKLNLGSIVPCASVNAWPQVNAAAANWVYRKVRLKYPRNIGMTLFETLTFPGLLINLDCKSISLFRKSQAGTPKMFAYQSAKGLAITKKKNGNILAAKMSEPWLLAWWGTVVKGKKIDIPMLLIFQRKPRKIYKSAESLNISFGTKKGGYLLIMPLYGIDKINTSSWEKGLPKKVVERARQWTRYSRSIPMNVEDSFKIDAKRDRVQIKYTYKDFLNIKDDWNTQPEKLCILPSMVGICYDYGYPVRLPASVKSLDYPAEFGPLYGASGTNEIEYSIPGAKFIVAPGYRKKLVDDPIVEKVRKLIPENTVDFFLTRPENKTWCVWRMRHISPAITKTLDLYNLYPDKQTRGKLRKYAENYIKAQQFYNSDTYYYYLDRVSGKTMNFSLGAELKGNPYNPPWITSAGDYLFGESTALYALGKYYDFFDKKEELKKHWECIRYRLDGFILQNDWEIPAPDHKTLGRGTSMSDFNNLFLSGYAAYARMAKTAGDTNAYQLSMYLLARNMLLQFSHWKGQAYAYKYRPYFMNNTRGNGSLEPEKDREEALLLRLREGYAWFMSSESVVSDSSLYFILGVLSSYELAQFFDRYLHDEVAKYLYKTLPALKNYDPDVITHQEIIFRTLIYEKDKEKALNLYKKISACKDFPLAPYVYAALYYENPIKIIPPPDKFVNKVFEEKLHSFPEPAAWKEIKNLSEYNLVWEIGQRNNSMKEFAIGQDRRWDWKKLNLKNVEKRKKYMDKLDAFVFETGKHKDVDFRGLQDGSSTTIPNRPELKNHPVNISFSLDRVNSKPFLLIDMVHLDPKSNTNFIIDINGLKRGITLPMPEYMFWLMASEVPEDVVSMEDREKMLAIPLPPEALKKGLNRLTITALGGVPVFYDWLGFGYKK